MSAPTGNLGTSARASLLWGGGFTLLRDVAQFGVMLILVRLLTPADYGTAALVQAILGVVAAISYATFSTHALQIRNPEEIDWQAHFTAAAVLNIVLTGLLLVLAYGLSFTARYREAALPLAALSVVLLIEIPGTLRHRMLEANHDWKRFRLLLIIGTFLGLGTGLAVALMGGGVWALIVQIPMLGLPAAVDLFWKTSFRPDWTWSWARYRDTTHFGFNRMGGAMLARVRLFLENGLMAATFDLATLGIFSRAVGLANLLAGRIGGLAMASLYPVVTRAERGTERFQRVAGLVMRGVAWTTVPIAGLLAMTAADTVQLLYGSQWSSVAPLLVLAAVMTGLIGLANALSALLLANEDSRAVLRLEVVMALGAMLLSIVIIPRGPTAYLSGLVYFYAAMVGVAVVVLVRRKAITLAWSVSALVPSATSTAAAVVAVVLLHRLAGSSEVLIFRLIVTGAVFVGTYAIVLRLFFARELAELLEVVPLGSRLARYLNLTTLGTDPDRIRA